MSSRGRGKRKKNNDDDGWGVWGGYMAAKVQKLNNQVKDIRQGSKSSIFKDISIFVNGYTNPAASDLRQLILEHGGVFHHYYKKELVSHVIASNLPNSKIANLNDKKVCKPEWITDSIKSSCLLPYQDYLLYVALSRVQPGLGFKTKSKDQISSNSLNSKRNSGKEKSSETADVVEMHEKGNGRNENHPALVKGDEIEDLRIQEDYAMGDDDMGSEADIIVDHHNAESSHVAGNTSRSDEYSRKLPQSRSESHSTIPPTKPGTFRSPSKAGDPSFLSEFYTHSRLHHLSTWGAELKAYVNEMQQQGDNSYPARDKLRQIAHRPDAGQHAGKSRLSLGKVKVTSENPLQRVILHIDMDCFFVSVGLRNRPDLVGKPIAVTHSKGKGVSKNQPGADLSYERAYYHNKGLKKKKGSTNNNAPDNRADEGFEEDLQDEENRDQTSRVFPTEQQTFHSMAEIASCSYEARNAGVKNGMFMGTAKELCPDIITIPYDFDGYNEVSRILYDTVASYTHNIEAVSCDEMLINCTDVLADTGATPQQFAALLREEIKDKTRCNASVGMGPSILIARLATRVAKPNGQHFVSSADVTDFIKDKPIKLLPGVGHTMSNKLRHLKITTCGDMQVVSMDSLQKELGPKTGQTLYNFCRGIDKRPIRMEKERKSVSAEINYGIRFTKFSEVEKFITGLADEVSNRLQKVTVKGKTITLKVKIRKKDAPRETAKFLGHGVCDNVAKSSTIAMATDNAKVIAKEALSLVHTMKIAAEDFRGMGIQVSRLESPIGVNHKSNTPSILQFTTIKPRAKTGDKETESKHAEHGNKDAVSATHTSTKEGGEKSEDLIQQKTHREENKSDPSAVRFHSGNAVPRPSPMLPDQSNLETSFSELMSEDVPIGHNEAKPPIRHSSEPVDDFVLPSPSQIDPAVLKELPADIRQQIQVALKKRGKGPAVGTTSKTLLNIDGTMENQKPGCSHWSSQPVTSIRCDRSEDKDNVDLTNAEAEAIVALPNFSQLDPSCMAALPDELRHELEKAYADQRQSKVPVKSPTQVHPLMRIQTSPSKSPGKSPKKSPTKSPGRHRNQSPVFKVPRDRPPGRKPNKLGPKKLEFQNQHRVNKNPDVLAKTIEITDTVSVTQEPAPVNICGAVSLSEVKALMKEWITSSPVPEEEDLAQFVQYLAELVQDKNLEQVHLLIKYLSRLMACMQSDGWQKGAEFILQQTQGMVKAMHGALLSVPKMWMHIS